MAAKIKRRIKFWTFIFIVWVWLNGLWCCAVSTADNSGLVDVIVFRLPEFGTKNLQGRGLCKTFIKI